MYTAMKRTAILVVVLGLVSACASAQTPQPAGQTQAPAGQTQAASPEGAASAGGVGGASLVDAASKVKDLCTLMPMDQAARLVPGGSAPQSQLFIPRTCTVTNQVSVLEITLQVVDSTDPVPGAESIPGLGADAYLETPLPDDAYLTVILGRDPGAILFVEVAGHDGKNHKDDAIAVAQAVIAKLQ